MNAIPCMIPDCTEEAEWEQTASNAEEGQPPLCHKHWRELYAHNPGKAVWYAPIHAARNALQVQGADGENKKEAALIFLETTVLGNKKLAARK